MGEYSFRHFLGLERLENRTPPRPCSGLSGVQELEGTGAGEYRDPTFLVVVPAFLVVVLARVPSCGYTHPSFGAPSNASPPPKKKRKKNEETKP